MRNKFMFFENFKSTADKLNDQQRLAFYDAITNYVFYDKEPEDPIISALLEAIKPSLNKTDGREKNGGNHNITGKNQYTKNESNLVNSGQSCSNLVKVGQSLIETENNITETETETETGILEKETTKEKEVNQQDKTLEIQFNTFWEAFPKQRKAGKTKPQQKFFQIVKSKQATAEQLIKAAEDYAKTDEVMRGYAKEPYSWLLNERYLCDYTTQIRPMPQMSLKEMKQMQNEIELEKIRRGEK